ncbi:MAG: glycoside hydrolase domain-containing protein, partial [Acidobacteriaceae bacterium]
MDGQQKKHIISNFYLSIFATLAVVSLLIPGGKQATAQACRAQNWSSPTPNVWAADGSIKVMLNNDPSTNQPVIPTYADDGNFNPWGFAGHPQSIAELNDVWSCPSGSPVITLAGAGRETVSFQVFISASAKAALSQVSVTVSPLTGAGTLTSDNSGKSNVTRYLEGYVPYSGLNSTVPTQVQANGQMPDPLIPFYDPYDSGHPAVATPFNVQANTTQGVWVNVSIPADQRAGDYSGRITISGRGLATTIIPLNVTVWKGNLPAFDAGSVDPRYADMLKSWLPFYRSNFDGGEGMTCGGPGCTTEQALYEKYQIMGHNYDMDVQIDADAPTNSGCYPAGACTSFTTNGTTSSLDWADYDAYVGPALTPGRLFSDGTAMRVFD